MTDSAKELLDRADGYTSAGRGADAAALYAQAADLAIAGGDLATATRAVLALARGQRYDATPGLLPARLHEVYLRTGDPAIRAALAAALARTWAYTGQPRRAVPFADTALSLARGLDDPAVLADCLDATMAAHWGPDELPRRRGWAAELDDTVAHLRDTRARIQAHLWGLTVAFETLTLPAIHRHLRALETLGEQSAEARFFAASRRLAVDLTLGRFDTAPYLRQLAAEAARDTFIADRDAILHAMTSYPALMCGDVATCAEEAVAYEEFGLTEGATAILAEGAWVWVAADRPDRALALLGHFDPDTLAGLPADADWLLTIQCVLEAAIAVADRDVIAAATELLTPYEGRAVINAGAVMFHGVTDDTLARANTLLGNPDLADRLRQQALYTYRRIGAAWWRERLEAWRPDPHHPAPAPATGLRLRFHRTPSGMWSIGPHDEPVTVPAMRGLEYLHHLLTRPGTDITAVDLTSAHHGGATVIQPDTGPAADRRALTAYRRRLTDINHQLEHGDLTTRVSKQLAAERDALHNHLAAATGLTGRPRGTGATTERARVAVRKAIVGALARIADTNPDLARHLHDRVSTGTTCRYNPDPDTPVHWEL